MSRAEAVSLRGTPRALSALVTDGGPELLALPMEVTTEAPGLTEPLVATYIPRAGGIGEIRVALPRKTPPGIYEATVALPNGEQPVVLEVEPEPRLRFHPRRLVVDGAADARVNATVVAFNEGNGPIEIPKTGGVLLFETEAAVCALGRALRAERKEGERFLDRIVEELVDEFGGTLRLNVESGAGVLDPDTARELKLVLHCPDGLKPGKTYSGTWTIARHATLPIVVRTAAAKKGKKS